MNSVYRKHQTDEIKRLRNQLKILYEEKKFYDSAGVGMCPRTGHVFNIFFPGIHDSIHRKIFEIECELRETEKLLPIPRG